MKRYSSGIKKVFFNYLMVVFVFVFFSIPFILFKLMSVYSVFTFILMCMLFFNGLNQVVKYEKNHFQGMEPSPVNGLIYSLGIFPFLILTVILIQVLPGSFLQESGLSVKLIATGALLGPSYFIMDLFKYSYFSIIVSMLVPPVSCFIIYFLLYKGLDVDKFFGKNKKGRERKPTTAMEYFKNPGGSSKKSTKKY